VKRRCVLVVASVCAFVAGIGADSVAQARVVGNGTARSCTSAAVVAAVRAGGTIRFSCGPRPVTIRMRATIKVRNTRREIVLDGGGGGAIFARGGRLRIERSTFTGNRCDRQGPDIGGGAVRALSQYRGLPVQVTDSRFTGNVCSNGGALSSIGVSWNVRRSRFTRNRAVGNGANPARPGTPGGGSGGAIYNDGNRYRLTIADSRLVDNHAAEGGGAVFFVSNDRTGTMAITDSVLDGNPSDGFETRGLPGIFFLGAGRPAIVRSILR
jgi:hypothetical protein